MGAIFIQIFTFIEIPPSPSTPALGEDQGDKELVCLSVDWCDFWKEVVDVISSCEEEKWS